MVVTTVDIPDDLLAYMDGLVTSQKARNRREIIVKSIAHYKRYDCASWENARINVGGFRKALVGGRLVELLTKHFSPEQFYEMGRNYGPVLRDYLSINIGKDPEDPSMLPSALSHLTDMGWGGFSLSGDLIIVQSPFFPKELTRGFLEAGLNMRLTSVSTAEDFLLFKIDAAKLEEAQAPRRAK